MSGASRQAIERNAFPPHVAAAELARGRARRFAFVMPSGPNLFMQQIQSYLGEMSAWLSARRLAVETVTTDVFDPPCSQPRSNRLPAISTAWPWSRSIIRSVRAAINDLVDGGTKVVTLVSDVPSSRRHHYVGIDNIAAGRTAGALVGRLVGSSAERSRSSPVRRRLRDHAERIFGFNQVMASEYPQLDVLPSLEGRDEDDRSEHLMAKLLERASGLVGLYNVGAGTPALPRR